MRACAPRPPCPHSSPGLCPPGGESGRSWGPGSGERGGPTGGPRGPAGRDACWYWRLCRVEKITGRPGRRCLLDPGRSPTHEVRSGPLAFAGRPGLGYSGGRPRPGAPPSSGLRPLGIAVGFGGQCALVFFRDLIWPGRCVLAGLPGWRASGALPERRPLPPCLIYFWDISCHLPRRLEGRVPCTWKQADGRECPGLVHPARRVGAVAPHGSFPRKRQGAVGTATGAAVAGLKGWETRSQMPPPAFLSPDQWERDQWERDRRDIRPFSTCRVRLLIWDGRNRPVVSAFAYPGVARKTYWLLVPSSLLKDLKEKKEVVEEAENGRDAPANGNANEENGEQEADNEVDEEEEEGGEEEEEEEEGDGEEEDGDEDEEAESATGKRAAEDDEDDDVDTKKQKTDEDD
uniref:prothymosin alpha isoform X1 n=1 Tax=Macaca mulatta TaxID=9544 RepID=UPI0010A23804|nr:prothymosin alpha isoform X1 [Macaca mulatta]XP_045223815.1 prothymosin alpha isoform X1 [Macaca fascicularis]